MRRTLAPCLILLLFPLAACAQTKDAPAEKPAETETAPQVLRVQVDVKTKLDGNPTPQNFFQYFVWERLNNFGMRIDSTNKVGDKRFDAFIDKFTKKWEKKAPGGSPALTFTAVQTAAYNGSVFYGEIQAHNLKGRMEAELKDAKGKTVASFSWAFSWGKSVHKNTRSEVQQQYDQMMQTALVIGVLDSEAIRAGVPKEKQAELNKYIGSQQAKLLKVLMGSTKAVQDGELATFLRSLGKKKGKSSK